MKVQTIIDNLPPEWVELNLKIIDEMDFTPIESIDIHKEYKEYFIDVDTWNKKYQSRALKLCKKICSGKYTWFTRYELFFELESDALMFKLMW